jgi:hypothetical protein
VSGYLLQWPAPCPGIPLFVHARNYGLLATLTAALATIPRGTITSATTTATWQAGLDRDLAVAG